MSENKLYKAIAAALECYKEEKGEPIGEGEQFTTIFNDCVLVIELEDGNLKTQFIIGEPYRIDLDVFD